MAKLITDPDVRKAIRDIKKGDKSAISLTDAAPRGAGRLMLKVTEKNAEWYAQRFVDGKRRLEKIGTFPALSVAEARRLFNTGERPQERAQAARSEDGQGVGSDQTCETAIASMFAAYVQSTGAKPNSVKQMESIFAAACQALGANKPAGAVTPEDIVAVIRPVYERGKPAQADKYRNYLGAAFGWAMRSAHDYRSGKKRVDWQVRSNPVHSIARDPNAENVGSRWLTTAEYVEYFLYLDTKHRISKQTRYAIQLIMLTGQRAQEILKIRRGDWNSQERTITWEDTKNGLPHVLPVCERAARLLDDLKPDRNGWYFPNANVETKPMPDGTLLATHNRYVRNKNKGKAAAMERFTSRDLRRTWKTLAGEAGVSKEDRDRLQNHMEGDVASVHYDRYSYMREKRAAVAVWQAWIGAEIAKRAA